MLTKDTIIDIAKQCFDPEIPVNIWDLGLIYDIDVKPENNEVNIRMSLTSEHCPAARMIPEMLKTKITQTLGVKNVQIEVVFDPAWTPERITEEGKRKLGLLDE
ncbi:MAG: metal-sulfur cluster assembly factor [Candidatus Omnitrophica bacterium]|nr:metal-sulfur cluster assembly factor [Candidatus Omnitrophota bacterium]